MRRSASLGIPCVRACDQQAFRRIKTSFFLFYPFKTTKKFRLNKISLQTKNRLATDSAVNRLKKVYTKVGNESDDDGPKRRPEEHLKPIWAMHRSCEQQKNRFISTMHCSFVSKFINTPKKEKKRNKNSSHSTVSYLHWTINDRPIPGPPLSHYRRRFASRFRTPPHRPPPWTVWRRTDCSSS